jgi:hypothetical protein
MSLSQTLKREVHQRAGGCCEYCKLSAEDAVVPFHVDHIIPRKHDGTDDQSNLCLACFDCNMYKSHDLTGFDPATGEITPLFNPRQQNWEEHFDIRTDMHIQEWTAQGRTTVRVLKINLSERLEDRRVLAELGLYPCT